MGYPLVAIGLDAADPKLIEQWMEQGKLPNLALLKQQGAYGRLKTFEYYRAETPWTTFLTGCAPEQTGYWAPLAFHADRYDVEQIDAYDFGEYQPFYALTGDRRVAVFDMPQAPLSDEVNGLQALGWGAHAPMTPTESLPASLLDEVTETYGNHPVLRKDHASTVDWDALKALQLSLETGIGRRADICQDLIQREPWDLFLTIFGESHAGGHYFWHLSDPEHPLYPLVAHDDDNPLLGTFQAIDRAVGDIASKAPDDANIVVFAAHGMGSNVMDLPSMVFLPEFLYRWNFPGHYGLGWNPSEKVPAKPMSGPRTKRGWLGSTWSLKYDTNPLKRPLRKVLPTKIFNKVAKVIDSLPFPDGTPKDAPPELVSPFALMEQGQRLYYQPATWYRNAWSKMKAFALPSFSEGYIRINLKGREPEGVVEPEDYDKVCDELIQELNQLKDARSGIPMVTNVIRTRTNPLDTDPKLPDADLVIMWQEDKPTDVVANPTVGHIGPIPYLRTGSHRSDGFVIAKGETFEPGSTLPNCHSLDLAPTFLDLMDCPIPDYFQGKPIKAKSLVMS
ncbi:MAG: alkaline phosphatase family protein [Cyanobacteria bacterium P01_F01_bin.150]